MALHINSDGTQKEIDLNLDSAIRSWGESPVLCTELRMSDWLGLGPDDEYECKRLDDGRLLFYSEITDGSSVQVLLTQQESSLVETMEENTVRSMRKTDGDEALIYRMTLQDVVSGDGSYSSSLAMGRVLNTKLYGVRLLIALLFAEKMAPAEIWNRSGLAASVFLGEIARMKHDGIFDGW